MPFLDEVGLQRVWSKVLDKTHPVGSLYWSSDPTNPGSLFGGTWVQIKDKFILAAGDKYKNGATGGSADAVVISHTHSIPALSGTAASAGAHTHKIHWPGWSALWINSQGNNPFGNVYNGSTGVTYDTTSAGAHTHSVTTNASTTGSQGVSGIGKNMPPYETYYCWKRTK